MVKMRIKLVMFVRSERAVSAVEFALTFPTLLIIMLGGIQLVFYLNAVRKVEQVAASVSEMISQATPASSATTIASVTALDIHFSIDSSLVIFPFIMKDAIQKNVSVYNDLSVNFSSINFTKTSNSCVGAADQSPCYAANVIWTSSGVFGNNYRPCLPAPIPVDDSASQTRYTLPRSIFGPGSAIAIDVYFTFVPTFGSGVIPSLSIARSVFVQPRYASVINFDLTGNDGIAILCP